MPLCSEPSREAPDRWPGRLFLLVNPAIPSCIRRTRAIMASASSAVDRDHGGKSCPPQPSNRINGEGRVFPHTSADAWLCKFHYDSRDAADEKREGVLEHAPRY
jgi:hypothetical protein